MFRNSWICLQIIFSHSSWTGITTSTRDLSSFYIFTHHTFLQFAFSLLQFEWSSKFQTLCYRRRGLHVSHDIRIQREQLNSLVVSSPVSRHSSSCFESRPEDWSPNLMLFAAVHNYPRPVFRYVKLQQKSSLRRLRWHKGDNRYGYTRY
jgi:hypothetical protein